ncbi:MAG: MFS transporter [Thermoguttaceae bacterium]|jgi:nucleoside transporter
MSSPIPLIRTRLSIMMFLEFLLWASWYVPIGGYMNSVLKFSGSQIGWIYATTALGAIIAPMFVGFIADRLFATERVLGVLHLVGGVCLYLASRQTDFAGLMTLLVINALCFMPTMALVNSLSFRNIDNPDRFSRIAVWGTIGWICSGLLVDFVLGGAEKPNFFYLASGGAIAMGLYSFTLPHTPPKGAEAGGDVLGLGALKLFADPSFLVFAVCAFLISIPLTFYFTWGNAFLVEQGYPRATALMTLCQFSEICVMIIMPWFIGRIGLKNVLVVGMGAWAVRYLLFSSMQFPLVIAGLLVHGFCYCFVFVAAFIYVSKKAPPEISASAQSLCALIMWGLGMFIGTQVSGWTGGQYTLAEGHHWAPIWLWPGALAAVVCVLFLLGGRDPKPAEPPLGK